MIPATTSFAYTHCLHIKRPITSGLDPTLNGYRIGIETGNVMFGVICILEYAHLYISCGLSLTAFASDIKNFVGQIKVLNQQDMMAFMIPPLLLSINLTGQSDTPRVLSWEKACELGFLDQQELLPVFEATLPGMMMRYYRFLLALVLNDTERMQTAMDDILLLPKRNRRFIGTHHGNYLFSLLDGLGGFILYQKTRQRKYRCIGRNGRDDLKKMPRLNSLPLLQFVEAEFHRICHPMASRDTIKSLYDKAIE